MKFIFILSVVIFLISCGSGNPTLVKSDVYLLVSKNDEDIEVEQEVYKDYWSALSHYEFDHAMKFANSAGDQEKQELAFLLKSMCSNKLKATDTARFVKLINTSNNENIRNYAAFGKNRYTSVNYLNPSFLDSFNLKHSDLYISETNNLRDSLNIWNKETPLVKVTIENNDFYFVFHTASAYTFLKQSAFEKLKLKQIDNIFSAPRNRNLKTIKSGISILPSIQFDKISIKNVPIHVTENQDFASSMKVYGDSTFQISGILGWDIIKRFNVRLDFKNKFLVLNQRHKSKVLKRQIFGCISPYVPISFDNGRKKYVIINSGGYLSEMNQFVFDSENESVATQKIQRATIAGVLTDSVKFRSTTLYLGDYKYKIGSLMVYSMDKLMLNYAGSLGNDLFSLGGYVLDYEAGCFKPYYYDKVKFE